MFGFGGGGAKRPTEPAPAAPEPPPASSKGSGNQSWSSFDPTGLERAAKAARELDQSRNSKVAADIVKQQEATKQLEYQAKIKEQEALYQAYEAQRIQKEYEEKRKTLEYETQQHQQRARYQDELKRKQYADQLAAQKYMKEQELKKQEEMVAKQEAIRRKTLEYEAELRQRTEMAKVSAETEGRIKQERMNHDLHIEQARLQAKENRETVLESIKLAGQTIGKGIDEFLADKNKMTSAVTTITLLAVGVYAAKVGTGVAGRFVESRLGKPSLVRETSRKNILQTVGNPVPALKRLFAKADDALEGVVLADDINHKLQVIARSTFNTKKNKAPFRNVLFYGPPGTGKTMFAKRLAKHSGLEYAILTGGDVTPLGREGVTEMHKLFDWAQSSRRGLLLFVDEADAFLQKRSNQAMSEDMRNALNAFLFRTGEASDKFMVVFATNEPEQFDWAINDRIDEMVAFRLPGLSERIRMLAQYFDKYILNPPTRWSSKITVQAEVNADKLRDVAEKIEGFSGREISKLAIALQAEAYGSADATLTEEMLDRVVGDHIRQHEQKQQWYHLDHPEHHVHKSEAARLVRD